jgi:hypothetical protein
VSEKTVVLEDRGSALFWAASVCGAPSESAPGPDETDPSPGTNQVGSAFGLHRKCLDSLRDRHERFELRDAWGRDIGRLLQNNSHLAGLRTFALESGQAQLGHTTYDYKRIDGAFGEVAAQTVTINDAGGRTIAGIVERRTARQLIGNDFYDYTLTFEYPPYEPMGILCLAVVLTEYFYRRTEHGGALRGIPGV